MGGRQQRTDPKWGHIFDHHSVVYDFPDGVKVFFTCRQQDNVATFVDEIVLGTAGQAQVVAHRITNRQGDKLWKYRNRNEPNMYRYEHQELFSSIRSATPINDGQYMCDSTMIAIMGRMATYTGKEITWDECVANSQRLGPEEYGWVDMPEPPVAIPGVTTVA